MRSIAQLLLILGVLSPATELIAANQEPRTPVLVELFTSEGCSSCPPADAHIAKLVRVQPLKQIRIVALSEHVDYWNSLGWKDPFSSPVFTQRQQAYARQIGTGVYTPQLVVDGTEDLVGSDRDETLLAIHRAARRAKVPLDITEPVFEDGSIEFEVTAGSVPEGVSGKLILWTALAEDGLAVAVPGGENSGLELRHDAVARRLEKQGRLATGQTRRVILAVDDTWNRDNLRVVVFLEQHDDGRIVGVATRP